MGEGYGSKGRKTPMLKRVWDLCEAELGKESGVASGEASAPPGSVSGGSQSGDSVSGSAGAEPVKAGEEQRTVWFVPGKLGMRWETGAGVLERVQEVVGGGQAEAGGVKVGWAFDLVDGEPYALWLLEAKAKGNCSYTVTFSIPDSVSGEREAGQASERTAGGPPGLPGCDSDDESALPEELRGLSPAQWAAMVA